MSSEIQKLAAMLEKCPYCGVRHAGKHNEKRAFVGAPGPLTNTGMINATPMAGIGRGIAAAARTAMPGPVPTPLTAGLNAMAGKRADFDDEHGTGGPALRDQHGHKKKTEVDKLREKLMEKKAFLPALMAALPAIGAAVGRTGLMAGGRALLGAGARAMANPVGNMVGQTAMQMGAQKLMQPSQPQGPRAPLPGQMGGI